MTKYAKIRSREPFSIDTDDETLRLACCDCGLVHEYAMKVDTRHPHRIVMYVVRDSRATGQLRRNEFGSLHQGVYGWKMERTNAP
jgi:hypothetical protein